MRGRDRLPEIVEINRAPVRTLVAATLKRIGLELIKSKSTRRASVAFNGAVS
jgi:hypothetical protein